MKRVLVLSDTHLPHESFLPKKLMEYIKSVDYIIHAGDFASYELYQYFKALKPVFACQGNNDDWRLKQELPHKALFTIESVKIGLCHGHGLSLSFSKAQSTLDRAIHSFSQEDVDLVIYGHSHKNHQYEQNGVVYYNPGSPTNKRFEPQYSFGILTIDDSEFSIENVFYK